MIKLQRVNKRLMLITALMLSSVLIMGICSISYAVWNNSLVLNTTILTGCIDINFDQDGYFGKDIKNIELVPNEPVRIQLSDESTIPTKFSGYQSELDDLGIDLTYNKKEGYIELLLNDDDPGLNEKPFYIELLFEQDTY